MARSLQETATLLLHRMGAGESGAASELLPLLYDELRGAAARAMRGERADHTLQTTALVNEAWLRVCGGNGASFESRQHFLRVAARAMRNVLVDHARARKSAKRGGDASREPLDDAVGAFEEGRFELLALDEALELLAAENERMSRIVELRYFGGLTLKEAGEVMDLSLDQVHYSWELARAWLYRELTRGEAG